MRRRMLLPTLIVRAGASWVRLAAQASGGSCWGSESGGRSAMSIYQAIETAMHGQDADKYVGLLHDDFQFVRHQSGMTMDKPAMAEMIRRSIGIRY